MLGQASFVFHVIIAYFAPVAYKMMIILDSDDYFGRYCNPK
jgi:hypothetical protein